MLAERVAQHSFRYRQIRRETERICDSLEREDYVIQSTPETSPPKWHLAHTSWFFDRFILRNDTKNCAAPHSYDELFNSYYETLGHFTTKTKRGTMSRPTLPEVLSYRARVDEGILELLETPSAELSQLIELGLQHEQQHQELLLMDIQLNAYNNVLRPIYPTYPTKKMESVRSLNTGEWIEIEEGIYETGNDGNSFAFDNERPRHSAYISHCAISSHLVTQGDFLRFIEMNGYGNPALWLSEGWRIKNENQWSAPLYWEKKANEWTLWTPDRGVVPLQLDSPVAYISYYEADAYARWKGERLPTEAEWEIAAKHHSPAGDFFSQVWQWTQSAYLPYPRYRPYNGSLSEYNGKFMSNQMVLRGSSYLTPAGHERLTYRNFYNPESRWQPAGLRLARDI